MCASSYGVHVCFILFMMVYMCVCVPHLIHDDVHVCVPRLEMCMYVCLIFGMCASSYGVHVCFILFMMVYMCVCVPHLIHDDVHVCVPHLMVCVLHLIFMMMYVHVCVPRNCKCTISIYVCTADEITLRENKSH